MKGFALFMGLLCTLTSLAQSDIQYREEIIFVEGKVRFTAETEKQLFRIWENLPPTARVELVLYSKKERKLENKILYPLTKRRSEIISLFLTEELLISPENIQPLVSAQPQKKKVSAGTNSQYRNMLNQKGIYSLVLANDNDLITAYTGDSENCLDQVEKQDFALNCYGVQEIYGKDGITLVIPENAFVNADGSPADCCDGILSLWEFIDKEDMVLSGLATQSGKRMLETGGMLYLEVNCNGNKMKLARGKRILIHFPKDEPQKGMQTFIGRKTPNVVDWRPKKAPAKIVEGGEAIWAEPDWDPEADWNEGETSGVYAEMDGYLLETGELGWINCDRFYEVTTTTKLIASVDTSLKPVVRMVFHDINSIMPGYYFDTSSSAVKFDKIPPGKTVTVIAYTISKDKKTVAYGEQTIVLGQTMKIKLEQEEMSKEEAEQRIAGLGS